LASIDRGEVATDAEVAEAFAKFQRGWRSSGREKRLVISQASRRIMPPTPALWSLKPLDENLLTSSSVFGAHLSLRHALHTVPKSAQQRSFVIHFGYSILSVATSSILFTSATRHGGRLRGWTSPESSMLDRGSEGRLFRGWPRKETKRPLSFGS